MGRKSVVLKGDEDLAIEVRKYKLQFFLTDAAAVTVKKFSTGSRTYAKLKTRWKIK
jgi:hypothetical protein